ncbi:acyltransferase GLAUCE-like [Magnolia sinica]|uniref:acyltransferase GLAUCE-like n=1 Tax=Magnolia sinica TaxID=86752 RepID=UPI002657DBE7|nr:acyltransferase GLAUCE-like [Magnolia sinica]
MKARDAGNGFGKREKDGCEPSPSSSCDAVRQWPSIHQVKVTRFKCGGFSIGFVINHSILDGKSAAEMFHNLASICRGEGLKTHEQDNSTLAHGFVGNAVVTACASAKVVDLNKESLGFCVEKVKEAIEMVADKYGKPTYCGPVVSGIDEFVLLLSDGIGVRRGGGVNEQDNSTLAHGFVGNAVVTACASAKVVDLNKESLGFCVEKVKEAIEMVADKYGKPTYCGPVVSGIDEFVLLLSDGIGVRRGGGVNVWMALEQEKMEKFMMHVFEM